MAEIWVTELRAIRGTQPPPRIFPPHRYLRFLCSNVYLIGDGAAEMTENREGQLLRRERRIPRVCLSGCCKAEKMICG
ncbi:hypothetical protein SLEP1_g17228 [Rubroshorea leprosula]|uniref:Uncharacterized protein n=1 Tax=Rubroshorea leprosula TaxID=152421 RepID=A0AAV5J162_9ROSI|nr:hypothetical protein SLEP1_g17228 [Rubroshorea leprosula]